MRISKRPLNTSKPKAHIVQTPTWQVEYEPNSSVFKADDSTTVIIEGDLYYLLGGDDKPVCFSAESDAGAALKRVYDSVGVAGFPESVEGIYNVAVIDEAQDTISITGDAFNRANLFYSADEKCPVISTELRDVLSCFDTIDYDPAVLSCILLLAYPPLKHSPYRGLRRLAIGERLVLQNDKMQVVGAEVKPVLSGKMDETGLDRYAEILENAVLSRSSQSENWVYISGGWDSTIILGVLRKYFDSAHVRAVVQAFQFSDGRCYNPYEVDKAVEIAGHYEVPVEVVTTDLADVNLARIWQDNAQARRSNLTYDWLPAFPIMANSVREKGKRDAAVFVGSFADALHNFGFSQYVSLPYLNYDFRHYSDKMRCYLYSPSFLKKVIDNTFEDDFAYKLFKWHYSKARFVNVSEMSRNERVFEYLLSFVMSGSRLPFACTDNESIFLNDADVSFKEWLYNNYFKSAVEQITCESMYFWLIWLYQHFHLQGNEKSALNASLRASGQRPCWPFYDLRLVRFLQMMPEDWGRGLEWRPIKYPLKYYGCEKLRIPYEIVESSFHSYIDETEQGRSIDWRSEVINKSILSSGTWKKVRSNPNLSKFFDQKWFDIAVLNDALQTGGSKSGTTLPLNLLALLSTGFEGW